MSEHLLQFPDRDTAMSERPDLFDEDGNLIAAIVTQAIISEGVPPVLDADGDTVIHAGTPPTYADGFWVLLDTAIEAEPIVLPEGIVGLSVIYASPMPAPVTA